MKENTDIKKLMKDIKSLKKEKNYHQRLINSHQVLIERLMNTFLDFEYDEETCEFTKWKPKSSVLEEDPNVISEDQTSSNISYFG